MWVSIVRYVCGESRQWSSIQNAVHPTNREVVCLIITVNHLQSCSHRPVVDITQTNFNFVGGMWVIDVSDVCRYFDCISINSIATLLNVDRTVVLTSLFDRSGANLPSASNSINLRYGGF
ncbi:hypothetical protein D9M71_430540 [compost metagenome]